MNPLKKKRRKKKVAGPQEKLKIEFIIFFFLFLFLPGWHGGRDGVSPYSPGSKKQKQRQKQKKGTSHTQRSMYPKARGPVYTAT